HEPPALDARRGRDAGLPGARRAAGADDGEHLRERARDDAELWGLGKCGHEPDEVHLVRRTSQDGRRRARVRLLRRDVAMSEALVQRWDGFLKNIKDRFDQIMQESKDGCAQMLIETNYDPIPMGNAWGAMERRAKELSTKIEETWNQQVEPKFEEAGVARPAIDEQ